MHTPSFMTISVSKSYNFDSSGAGTYTIEARDVMHHYVDSHAQVLSLKAATAKYKITVPKPTPRYKAAEKRAEVGTCSETQVSLLQAASHDAHQYAVESFTYVIASLPVFSWELLFLASSIPQVPHLRLCLPAISPGLTMAR